MADIGNRVYTRINRPDPSVVAMFEELNAADIADCMNKMASMDSGIRPLNGAKLVGTAFTVKVTQGNNLFFHYALSLAQAGDVIVVDGGGFTERGLCGENMVEIAAQRGIRGFVVDGAVRDTAAIREHSSFPVYARATIPNASYKAALPGEINVPITVGGIVVYPGDIMLGDDDGIVAVNPKEAVRVACAAKALAEKQAANLALIRKGTSNRAWVLETIQKVGTEIIDKTWDQD